MTKNKSETLLEKFAMALLLVGGLNWGLISLAEFDLVATLFGEMSLVTRMVYSLVGAAAVYLGSVWLPRAMK